jgi:hypothetical protein
LEDLIKRIKVFLASPGDVTEERAQLPKIIQDINLIISAIAPEKKVLLDLIKWETNTYPSMGNGAQAVINEQIPEYNIFIGIMWKRFGTPTTIAGSGTEEEFSRAYAKWQADNNFPVLFYFCQDSSSFPKSLDELDQLRKVIEFKEKLSKLGLIWEYKDHSDFADMIRNHLVMSLSRLLSTSQSNNNSIKEITQLTTDSGLSIVRNQVAELKTEYEDIRKNMKVGNDRTRLMSVVESKMRAIALQIFPLLPQLINSDSPGERLAAIATLKEIPDKKYLNWLANRVGSAESSFVGFNATLALLTATRNINNDQKAEVEAAINTAVLNLNASTYKDPNQVEILKQALIEINSK